MLVTRNPEDRAGFISYNMISENLMTQYSIIINCTPVGMWPQVNECPQIPYNFITPKHYCFDLIYKPGKTLFLQNAEQLGAEIQNGYNMLIIQAEESWRLWNLT